MAGGPDGGVWAQADAAGSPEVSNAFGPRDGEKSSERRPMAWQKGLALRPGPAPSAWRRARPVAVEMSLAAVANRQGPRTDWLRAGANRNLGGNSGDGGYRLGFWGAERPVCCFVRLKGQAGAAPASADRAGAVQRAKGRLDLRPGPPAPDPRRPAPGRSTPLVVAVQDSGKPPPGGSRRLGAARAGGEGPDPGSRRTAPGRWSCGSRSGGDPGPGGADARQAPQPPPVIIFRDSPQRVLDGPHQASVRRLRGPAVAAAPHPHQPRRQRLQGAPAALRRVRAQSIAQPQPAPLRHLPATTFPLGCGASVRHRPPS